MKYYYNKLLFSKRPPNKQEHNIFVTRIHFDVLLHILILCCIARALDFVINISRHINAII
jgi:hypothetical protein